VRVSGISLSPLPHRVRQSGARGGIDGLIRTLQTKNRSLEHGASRSGHQVIRREGERMVVSGALTLANVAAVLRDGNAAIGEGVRTVDLAEVGELDPRRSRCCSPGCARPSGRTAASNSPIFRRA